MRLPVLRILSISDSAIVAANLNALKEQNCGIAITNLRVLDSGLELLRHTQFDLISVGCNEGSGNVDVLRRLHDAGVSTPVVAITHSDDEYFGLTCIREGAQDYIAVCDIQKHLIRLARRIIERCRVVSQAESTGSDSDAQYRRFIEEAPAVVALLDRNMRYLAVSNGWMDAYGNYGRDLLGLCHYDVHPDLPERWRDAHNRALSGESLHEDRDYWVLEDGSSQWLRWSIQPWRDHTGTIGGIVITVEDITERVKAENALRFTEDLMREAGNIAKVGGWAYDVPSGKGFWTEEIARIYEIDPKEVLGKQFGLSLYVPESRARIELALWEAMTNAIPYDLELEIQTTRGSRKWIRAIGRPIVENAKVVRLQGSFQDITDRKTNEEILRRQASLIDQAYDAVFAWEREGYLIFWNRAAERIYGYSKEEAIGRRAKDLLKTVAPAGSEALMQTLTETGSWEGELQHTCRDGRHIIVEARMVQVTESDHKYILQTNRDASEKRHLEEQLRQSQKMEAIGRLAGGVAHDFNNLLGVILGYAELIPENSNLDVVKTQAVAIQKAALHAANLTRQLLAFSRKQVLDPKIVNLGVKIQEMSDLLTRVVGEDINVSFAISPDILPARLDPGQVEQIILNLVVNARDAMPDGGDLVIEVENAELDESFARLHSEVHPGRYVMIAVRDTGVGMDAETLAHIFEPFYTTKPNGTGLGLSTVYGAVQQSGGHIWTYSELGRGAIFKVYFPCIEGVFSEEVQAEEYVSTNKREELIVLVEDSDDLRKVAKEFLESDGYAVKHFSGGEEALQFASEFKYPIHLLVADVIMPRMSGRELAEELKKVHPETRVLYMSGYTADTIHHHGVLGNGIHLVSKPFSRLRLVGKVREILDSL